jgi:hypothetical protein
MEMELKTELEQFFDPDNPNERWRIVLRHVDDDTKDCWHMERRLGYNDREIGEIVVPRDKATFTTDLTSVPQMFTWLVPRTGTHLAAALVHDALTPPFSADGQFDWEKPDGPVTQLQADRVFRNAMADLGTPLIRRWMVWSAVTVPTARTVSKPRAYLGYASLVAIAVLGWFATLDLFDRGEWLPWMADRKWQWELLIGGGMAIVVPLLLAFLWPPDTKKAGAIVGVGLAALLHVTVLVGLVTFAYQVLEYRHKVWAGKRWYLKVLATIAVAALAWLTHWMFQRYDS